MERSTTSKCVQCGAGLQTGDRFCGNCGASIGDATTPGQPSAPSGGPTIPDEPPTHPTRSMETPVDAAEGGPAIEPPPTPPVQPRPRKRRKPLLLTLAGVITVGAGIYALTFFNIVDLDLGRVSQIMGIVKPPQPNRPPLPQPDTPTLADYKQAIENALDGKDFKRAENNLHTALGRFPQDPDLLTLQALYYFKCDQCGTQDFRKAAALQAATRAFEISPTDQRRINLGWIYQELGNDCRAALFHYEQGIGWGNDHPDLFYFMGICYQELGYLALAKAHFEKYLHAAPKGQYTADIHRRLAGR